MSSESQYLNRGEESGLARMAATLSAGRAAILQDWLDRVRDNSAVQRGRTLSDPLLLDHIPQLFDAIVQRLEIGRPREEAEQAAMVHGFARRVSGYDVAEMVVELLMLRRSIWAHVPPHSDARAAYRAMERIDGMIDRAVISSLRAYLDPDARMLERRAMHDSGDREPSEPDPETQR